MVQSCFRENILYVSVSVKWAKRESLMRKVSVQKAKKEADLVNLPQITLIMSEICYPQEQISLQAEVRSRQTWWRVRLRAEKILLLLLQIKQLFETFSDTRGSHRTWWSDRKWSTAVTQITTRQRDGEAPAAKLFLSIQSDWWVQ